MSTQTVDKPIAITGTTAILDERTMPENGRITVLLHLPHLADFGYSPLRELVYGCRFPVALGDLVDCPPTPMKSSWTVGTVIALSGRGYKGRVKYVKRIGERQEAAS